MRFTIKTGLSEKIFLLRVFVLALSFSMSPAIFAQQQIQAVIREMAGTVEVKQGNSEVWVAASRGQTLSWDTVVSTGFRSTAVIALGDSIITMRPLTRLSVLELSQSQGSEKVDLNLQTGRVRADVKAPGTGQTEFVIRSPNSTSSVRGTIFEFDTLSITVIQGTVEFKGVSGVSKISGNSGVSAGYGGSEVSTGHGGSTASGGSEDSGASRVFGPPQLIDAGGFSQVEEYTGRVSLPPAGLSAELRPEPPIASEPISVSAQPSAPQEPQSPPTGPAKPSTPQPPPPQEPQSPPAGPSSPSTPPSSPGDGKVDFGPIILNF